MDTFASILILSLASSVYGVRWNSKDHFDVTKYGAIGDGSTDDSKAFQQTWDAACSAEVELPRIIVPQRKTFFLNPIMFNGPCRAGKINFQIYGKVIAPDSPNSWDGKDASLWLAFKDVNGLNVDGFGTIDGRGRGWWDQSCRYHPDLADCTKLAPTAMKFLSCNASSLSNMNFMNSPQTHILIRECSQFKVENIVIQSPGNSPNTDGIHVHQSQDISIFDAKIGTGDDCISIGDYISKIQVANIECGPGHGISIGSLGKGGNYVQVEDIHVSDAVFKGTTNGARIKTWQVGRGYVRDVIFENLEFISVKNPIIIDQNYCDVRGACKEMETGVHISNVVYKEMSGTSSTDVAINLGCSRSVPCTEIYMESIQLESAQGGYQVIANCSNAYGRQNDVTPGCSLADEASLCSNKIN